MGRMPPKELDIALGVLKELTREQRIIIGLYFYENLSAAQISQILGSKEEQVQATIEMVLRKIQQYLPIPNEMDSMISLVYG